MNAGAVLELLKAVRQTGPDRYLARCPAHEDRSPSLSIRALDDGRILMHCFAGCDIEDVTGALGLEVGDLFPDRPLAHATGAFSPPKLRALEALEILGHEISVTAILLEEIRGLLRAGGVPSDIAMARLGKAIGRIQAIRNFTETNTPPEIKAIRRGAA